MLFYQRRHRKGRTRIANNWPVRLKTVLRAVKTLSFLWPKLAPLGPPFRPQNPPDKVYVSPLLRPFPGKEAQKLFFRWPNLGCFGWGAKKLMLKKVYVLCLSPMLVHVKESRQCIVLHLQTRLGRMPKGSYSPRGRSGHLLEIAFSEPLLRTLFTAKRTAGTLLRTLLRAHPPEPFPEPSQKPS